MSRSVRLTFTLAMLLICLTSVACSPAYLKDENYQKDDMDFRIDEDAKIKDTKSHREVLDVMAQYRMAIVKKDFGTLNRLVAKEYYDNASTTHTTKDDYGRDELKSVFELMAKHTDSIQYRMLIKEISIKKKSARVDYEYRYAYQYKVGDEVSWDAGVEVNRVELRSFDGEWKIVAGM